MDSVILRYVDNSGVIQKFSVPFLVVRGLEDPDKFAPVPNVIYKDSGGTKRTMFVGFRRIITVEFNVLNSYTLHRTIFNFIKSNTKSVYFGITAGREEEVIVASDIEDFEATQLKECVLGKKFHLDVVEDMVRNVWPDYVPAIGAEIMYCRLNVIVEGTEELPETFTTNSGKLLTMETGYAFPAISLLTWVVTVKTISRQQADAYVVGDVVNSGTNLQFQLAVKPAGSPSGDGLFHFDIEIILQARP